MKQLGFPGVNFDYEYGGRYNDIFEPAGFTCHGKRVEYKLLVNTCCVLWFKVWYMNTFEPFRCAILSLLRLHPCSLVVLAPVCSGFSFMRSSQSMRTFFCPLGDESRAWVKAGNVMSVRVTLLCWLAAALGHTFIVEQPGSAKFGDMPRWRWFSEEICIDPWVQ